MVDEFDDEQCLLAAMMLDSQIIPSIFSLVHRGHFRNPAHRIIFDAIETLCAAPSTLVDAVSVREELVRTDDLDAIGGTAYLATVLSSVPSAIHGIEYAMRVSRKA